MKTKSPAPILLMAITLAMPWYTGCDTGGIPVELRIDEFTMDLSVDDLVDDALAEFKALGVIPPETQYLPEFWPESLPAVKHQIVLTSPAEVVDLTPDPGSADADKYSDISKAEGVIARIDLNRLVVRIEASSLTMDLPELRLQLADQKDADPDDRLAWRTIGSIPGAGPGFVGDLEFAFVPGGESFLRSQMSDDLKEFAIRVRSKIEFDTDQNPRLPAGLAKVRLIVVATFFVDPIGAIEAI